MTRYASLQVQRDVVDGRYHGAHEGRPGEEERPAVSVCEGNASSRRRRSLLAMRHFVIDGRDVEDDAHRQRQGYTRIYTYYVGLYIPCA